MIHREGYTSVVVFLDDFYCGGSIFDDCQQVCSTLVDLLRWLGFHINWSKIVDPTRQLVFLGVHIDTEVGLLWLDPGKIKKLHCITAGYINHKHTSRKQLEI